MMGVGVAGIEVGVIRIGVGKSPSASPLPPLTRGIGEGMTAMVGVIGVDPGFINETPT